MTALDTARRAFGFLLAGPHPISLDGRAIPGLPPRFVPLDQVQELVMHSRCPQRLRDGVWCHLTTRSRVEGGTWTVACVGMALPALVTIAARLSARHRLEAADLHAAVLAGFLTALAEIDLARPGVMNRLRWAAYRSGHAALREALDAPEPGTPTRVTGGPLGRSVEGHPDLVLARAVAEGLLTAREADVIAVTRLDGRSLTRFAQECGSSYEALKKTRARAERRLAGHLTTPRTPPSVPSGRSRSVSSAAAGGPLPGGPR
ncbi:sigma-70 RNA polymerase sigma factor region 4 domain-containing protein [Saccharopolyspora rosea]|uniref:sigma-70 family RNA polymerase sigma factor n=1 Tax=Saccharopolyspora rosea TaxID=524884 RepID=UPI0021D9CA31|nr:sigma-70 family RNA polymerase sigma factor [Saccharopolyspora rosea]